MHLHLSTCVNRINKHCHTCMHACVSHFVDAQVETCQIKSDDVVVVVVDDDDG